MLNASPRDPSGGNPAPPCTICRDEKPFTKDNHTVTSCKPVNHHFHSSCIEAWHNAWETNRRHCAVCKQCPLPLKRIIPNIEEENPDYECAAAAYARSGNLTELNKLLDADKRLVNDTFDETKVKEKKVVTLLFIAAQEGHANIVDRLIDLGADKNKGNKNGATPLYIAAENGRTDTVRCLVSEGADKDKVLTSDGVTPLWIAAYMGHTEIVRHLVSEGADKDKGNKNGVTPLYIAAENGRTDTVRCLVGLGVDKDKGRITDGATPLWIAAYMGHTEIVQCLVGLGADKDKGLTTDGATPLYIAAENGRTDTVRCLVSEGADKDKGHHRSAPGQ